MSNRKYMKTYQFVWWEPIFYGVFVSIIATGLVIGNLLLFKLGIVRQELSGFLVTIFVVFISILLSVAFTFLVVLILSKIKEWLEGGIKMGDEPVLAESREYLIKVKKENKELKAKLTDTVGKAISLSRQLHVAHEKIIRLEYNAMIRAVKDGR